MLLLPGNPGLLLFHIAVVFAEGDEREVEGGRQLRLRSLCIVASHRTPPTSASQTGAAHCQRRQSF